MSGGQTHVVIDGGRHLHLTDNDRFDFGRASTDDGIFGLDPQDMGISRLAGSVHKVDTLWVLTNRSGSVPLHLDVDASGQFHTLPPGQRHLINDAVVIVVKGLRRMHRIDVLVAGDTAAVATVRPQIDTQVVGATVTFTEGELDCLTAVYRGFLEEFPRRDCVPLTYNEAGLLLDLPGSTVRKRIEKVRAKLADQGVYVEGPNARWELATFVLDAGMITPDDLARLP